jgi:hypothetical protein
VVIRSVPVTDRYRITGRTHRPETCLSCVRDRKSGTPKDRDEVHIREVSEGDE